MKTSSTIRYKVRENTKTHHKHKHSFVKDANQTQQKQNFTECMKNSTT